MAPEKVPAFQFYPKDFLSDERVQMMSYTERGLYITLLCSCWLEGSLPADPGALAKLLKVPVSRFRKLWQGPLGKCFRPGDDGRLGHKRLDVERRKQEDWRTTNHEKGVRGAAARWGKRQPIAEASSEHSQSINQVMLGDASSVSDLRSASPEEKVSVRGAVSPPRAKDPFVDREVTARAGRFCERYAEFFPKHRKGARYVPNPVRDYAAAVELCAVWDDERLDKLAVCFLTTDHKFAAEGSRTISQFKAIASWVDGELAAWETKQA